MISTVCFASADAEEPCTHAVQTTKDIECLMPGDEIFQKFRCTLTAEQYNHFQKYRADFYVNDRLCLESDPCFHWCQQNDEKPVMMSGNAIANEHWDDLNVRQRKHFARYLHFHVHSLCYLTAPCKHYCDMPDESTQLLSARVIADKYFDCLPDDMKAHFETWLPCAAAQESTTLIDVDRTCKSTETGSGCQHLCDVDGKRILLDGSFLAEHWWHRLKPSDQEHFSKFCLPVCLQYPCIVDGRQVQLDGHTLVSLYWHRLKPADQKHLEHYRYIDIGTECLETDPCEHQCIIDGKEKTLDGVSIANLYWERLRSEDQKHFSSYKTV